MNKDIELATEALADAFATHSALLTSLTESQQRVDCLDAEIRIAQRAIGEARKSLESLLRGEKSVGPQEGKGRSAGCEYTITCPVGAFNAANYIQVCKWSGHGR